MADPIDRNEAQDLEKWSAIEEAVELLVEGQFAKAVFELNDVLKADSRNHYAYHHLGNALFELQRLEPARDAYRAALVLKPRYLASRVGLSHTLRMLGDIEGAIRQGRAASKAFPKDGDVFHALGLALAARGDQKEAKSALTKFLDSDVQLEAQLEVRQMIEMMGELDDDEPFEIA